jgi:Peptidase family M28
MPGVSRDGVERVGPPGRAALVVAAMMSVRVSTALVVAVLAAVGPPPVRSEGRMPPAAPEPELARLRAIVETLASPPFEGRRGPGGEKAADYLVHAFRDLGLEPLFDGEFLQPIPGREPGQVQGRNVGAKLVGSDPALRDEWVILSAHYDHLGVKGGVLYPGADDNASGVAMMLEVARALTQSPERPRRSVMLLGFDLEEIGLFGSRYFADHLPVPQERIALFLTADLIGRSLGDVCEPYVFAIGSEHAPGLRPWLDQAARDRPLTVGLLGTDMVGTRSDYGPFRNRKIPYLFFSTGENPHYHKPTDTADTINYPKLEAISRLICSVVREAASADAVPRWSNAPEYPFSEVAVVRDLFRTLLDHAEELKIGATQNVLMRKTLHNLDSIIARGSITPAERTAMVRVVQIVMISVF